MRKEGNGERSLHGGVADSHQIFGAQEQYIQIFILPCKWFPSFSFLFGVVHTVIMQANNKYRNMLLLPVLQRLDAWLPTAVIAQATFCLT